MIQLPTLTTGAQELLNELQRGSNVAEPRHYLAAEGYRHLARATLDNAVALCSTDSSDDFRIFSALYAVRHGLELWLKSLIIDVEIDRLLAGIAAGNTLDELKDIAIQDRPSRDRRQAERGFIRTLCQFRNLALGLRHPEFRGQEIEERFCVDGIAKALAAAEKPRYGFDHAWAIPIAGHDLKPLWVRARARFDAVTSAANVYNQECVGVETLPAKQLSSACELFGSVDSGGNTFRYPTSIARGDFGDLHRMQRISLEALGRFASTLNNTVVVYGGTISDSYAESTMGHPLPYPAIGV